MILSSSKVLQRMFSASFIAFQKPKIERKSSSRSAFTLHVGYVIARTFLYNILSVLKAG